MNRIPGLVLAAAAGIGIVMSPPGVAQQAAPPAFPGAEGYGAVATGGRGGQVIKVTTLNATGPGSLQEAVSTPGARTVVFAVSGVIKGNIMIPHGDLTIAGQTAPGGGITIAGYLRTEYKEGVDNIIVRHLRVRPNPFPSDDDGDAIQFSRSDRWIADHVSASWGGDETFDMYEAKNVTVQWSTIEDGGTWPGDPNKPNYYGMINGPDGGPVSIHHNLFVNNQRRSPAVDNGPSDIRNNVMHNVRDALSHENAEEASNRQFNLVGNYIRRGPNSATVFPFSFADGFGYYTKDNYVDDPPEIQKSVENPWAETYEGFAYYSGHGNRATTPYSVPPVTTHSSTQAYTLVLDRAGAFPRDVVTKRSVQEVRDRGGAWAMRRPGNLMEGLTPAAPPADSDNDGMPNAWESAHGLNPNNGADHSTVRPSGYTAIEEYINGLA